MNITIKDTTFSGKPLYKIELHFTEHLVSLKEIISRRVLAEVVKYNHPDAEYVHSLVHPPDSDETINGIKYKKRRKVDGEKQVYLALDAFQKHRYFVLINGIQAVSLDQQVDLSLDIDIHFIKFRLLVGG